MGRRDGLFQLARNRRKCRVELRSEAFDNRDDCYRDAGGDQPVLDGRSSGLVPEKCFELHHQHAEIYARRG
jgi:hypothetical protein